MSEPLPTSSSGPSAPGPAPVPAAAVPAVPAPVETLPISIDDFKKVRLVTAEVVEARAHPKADRLLLLQVDLGGRRKQIVSGIREFYAPEQMIGKTVIVVDNLQPAKLRGELSEGMLLAVLLPGGGLRILVPDGPAPSGLPVS